MCLGVLPDGFQVMVLDERGEAAVDGAALAEERRRQAEAEAAQAELRALEEVGTRMGRHA
jgi:hypothetical protein